MNCVVSKTVITVPLTTDPRDRGRFGYGYVNLKDRPRQPVQRRGDDLITLNAEQAMQGAADILRQSKKVIGIGSPRASVESNFALRELVGADNFYTGIAQGEQERLQLALSVLRDGGIHTPALREIESYDAVLVLGEDVTQTGARVALAVRQAVKGKAREMAAAQKVADWQIAAILNIGQRAKHPLFVTNVDNTRLDDIAAWTYRAPVEDQARLGFAIAHALDNNAPAVDGIDRDLQNKIDVIVQALAGAKKPLIISGTNAGSAEVIQAAANVAKALKGRGADVGITMIARSVNSMGLGMIGGGSLDDALTELETGRADAVVVLENDLHRHASATRVNAALAKAPLVLVIDHQRTAIMENAHLVLSAASFAESDGTVINNEGRAQRFFQVYDPSYYDSNTVMLESWRWLHSLHSTVQSREVDWTQLDHVIDAVVEKSPGNWRVSKMPLRTQASLSVDRNWHVNRTATAVVPQCAPTSAYTNRASRRTKTLCSPSLWKGTTNRLRRVHKFRLPGLRAGTPHRRGTSSRMKWAVNCVMAIRACV